MNVNVTNTSLPIAPVSASAIGSHRISIAFDSQREFAVPLTSVQRLQNNPNAPHESMATFTTYVVEETPTPYSHWGINE